MRLTTAEELAQLAKRHAEDSRITNTFVLTNAKTFSTDAGTPHARHFAEFTDADGVTRVYGPHNPASKDACSWKPSAPY